MKLLVDVRATAHGYVSSLVIFPATFQRYVGTRSISGKSFTIVANNTVVYNVSPLEKFLEPTVAKTLDARTGKDDASPFDALQRVGFDRIDCN